MSNKERKVFPLDIPQYTALEWFGSVEEANKNGVVVTSNQVLQHNERTNAQQ